jgi:hypothetical protein
MSLPHQEEFLGKDLYLHSIAKKQANSRFFRSKLAD